jgi:RNA polymerase sigma factor (TIGR02999 family)
VSAPATTVLVADARSGDARAADLLFGRVYDELRRLSQSQLRAEAGAVTISATGLVHEAYLKLLGADGWADRGHFVAVAARAMRQILTDRARARGAQKRGGGAVAVTLVPEHAGVDAVADDVLAVDAALDRLAGRDAGLAKLVELRFFGGLEVAEAAEVLGVSERTAARHWARAKAHLRAELGGRDG